jgi:hypothetical protein
MQVEALCSSGTFVDTYKSTWRYSPEYQHQHDYHIVKIYQSNLIKSCREVLISYRNITAVVCHLSLNKYVFLVYTVYLMPLKYSKYLKQNDLCKEMVFVLTLKGS